MKIAVLGAGNGGLATAAHAAVTGFDVSLFSRSLDRLGDLARTRTLHYDGVLGAGSVRLAFVGAELSEATAQADLVVICVPSTELEDYGARLAQVLSPDTVVLLNPGGTFGSLRLQAALRSGAAAQAPVAELSTLAYAARRRPDGTIYISNLVGAVPAGVFPAAATTTVTALVRRLFPTIDVGPSVLYPALHNLNPIEHPAQAILNAGRIEDTGGDFYFYIDGTTPAVGRVIDDTDAERRMICAAYGVRTKAFVELFAAAGYTTAEAASTGSAHAALQASEANRTFRSPATLQHRYVLEDIGHSLLAWEQLAQMAGVSTPVISSQITIASSMMGTDFRTDAGTALPADLDTVADVQAFLSGTAAAFPSDSPEQPEETP